jgi:hypothetical protein
MAQFNHSNASRINSMANRAFIGFRAEHNIGNARPENDDFIGDTPRPTGLSSGHSDCHIPDGIMMYSVPVSSDPRSYSTSSMPTSTEYKHARGGLEDAHANDMWACPNPYGGCEGTWNPSWHSVCPLCGAAKPS